MYTPCVQVLRTYIYVYLYLNNSRVVNESSCKMIPTTLSRDLCKHACITRMVFTNNHGCCRHHNRSVVLQCLTAYLHLPQDTAGPRRTVWAMRCAALHSFTLVPPPWETKCGTTGRPYGSRAYTHLSSSRLRLHKYASARLRRTVQLLHPGLGDQCHTHHPIHDCTNI